MTNEEKWKEKENEISNEIENERKKLHKTKEEHEDDEEENLYSQYIIWHPKNGAIFYEPTEQQQQKILFYEIHVISRLDR